MVEAPVKKIFKGNISTKHDSFMKRIIHLLYADKLHFENKKRPEQRAFEKTLRERNN
jgi:hypothetical protein